MTISAKIIIMILTRKNIAYMRGEKWRNHNRAYHKKKDVLLRYNGNIVSLKAVCLSVCLAA